MRYLRAEFWPLTGAFFFSACLAVISFLPAPGIKFLMDQVLLQRNYANIRLLCFGMIGIGALNLVCRFLNGYLVRSSAHSVMQRLRIDLYAHLLRLSQGYFLKNKAGSQVSRVINDVQTCGRIVTSVVDAVKDPVLFFILLGYAFYLNWRLAAVTVLVLPFLALLLVKSGQSSKRYSNRILSTLAEMSAAIVESAGGIRVIQSFTLEPYLSRRFQRVNRDFTRTALKAIHLEALTAPGAELLLCLTMTGLLSYAGHEAIQGNMSPGAVLAFFSCFPMMLGPLKSMNDLNITMHQSSAALESVFTILNEQPEIRSPQKGRSLRFQSGLRFENLSFAYPDQREGGIEGLSFSVNKGETLALVGPSGAGKSTVLNLVLRLFDPKAGRVLVDGVDLRDYSLGSVREQIGFVTQDVFLFHDTIGANIRGGNRFASQAEVEAAAKAANAWDFIQKLPDGLDTVVGDRGQKLSGGERQRISIARAILKNAPILLLDEATSALDSASERLVQESLDRLAEGRTVLVVAHRLSTIRRANRVLVLERGRLVEEGTHTELLARDGAFARAIRMQSGSAES